jgi:outer membrane protein
LRILIYILLLVPTFASAQRIAFISSDLIREKFPEAKRANQRIQSGAEQWDREFENYQIKIDNIELEIKQNRLIWTEQELKDKNAQLAMLKRERNTFAKNHYESGGKYDEMVKAVWEPIEQKIFAATQEVAVEQGFDFIFDKSLQPIPYANYKYDMTLKVLEKLGYDISQLQRDLQKKIDNDPRNQQKTSKTPQGKRGREDGRTNARGRNNETPPPIPTDIKPQDIDPTKDQFDPANFPTDPASNPAGTKTPEGNKPPAGDKPKGEEPKEDPIQEDNKPRKRRR